MKAAAAEYKTLIESLARVEGDPGQECEHRRCPGHDRAVTVVCFGYTTVAND